MRVGVPKEIREGEARVALTPLSVAKLTQQGFEVLVETGAGLAASFSDEAYQNAGAVLGDNLSVLGCDLILKINRPIFSEIELLKKNAFVIALMEPYQKDGVQEKLAAKGVNVIAMELLPRISRAQSMDVLSSQANIAGYRAALEAATCYKRFIPMMMTSAKPAKVAVLGVGVAGLQAISTMRRLGARVEAYDIRPEVKEQILSVGAKPIELELGEMGHAKGGYAQELSDDGKKKQQALLSEKLKTFDIIISTANVPGRKAPVLVTEETIRNMRHGSVVIDMAAADGGNCPLSEPDRTVVKHGISIVGFTNFPALLATDASEFWARNMLNLLALFTRPATPPALNIDLSDEIVSGVLSVYQGEQRFKK